MSSPHPLNHLEPVTGHEYNVIIETPQGSRNELTYNAELGLFELGGVQPSGFTFPYDFGFLPCTEGGDGDPLDVLVLLEEPLPTGVLVRTRLLGVIEAEQTSNGMTVRNDRFIGVPTVSREYGHLHTLQDLRPGLLDEIEHFFISYNEGKGKHFRPLRRSDPQRARKIVEEAAEQFRKQKS